MRLLIRLKELVSNWLKDVALNLAFRVNPIKVLSLDTGSFIETPASDNSKEVSKVVYTPVSRNLGEPTPFKGQEKIQTLLSIINLFYTAFSRESLSLNETKKAFDLLVLYFDFFLARLSFDYFYSFEDLKYFSFISPRFMLPFLCESSPRDSDSEVELIPSWEETKVIARQKLGLLTEESSVQDKRVPLFTLFACILDISFKMQVLDYHEFTSEIDAFNQAIKSENHRTYSVLSFRKDIFANKNKEVKCIFDLPVKSKTLN